jgi:hypothetical protein
MAKKENHGMRLSIIIHNYTIPEVARPTKPLMLKAETITAGQNGVTCLDQSADLTSYD